MPAVLVHGVPDTHHVWQHVRNRVQRDDVVTLSLPGFGCPRPDGFTATKEAYVDWLLDELVTFDRPIDLVGHDWGALLVLRVVSLHPELVRTWIAGGAAIDPDYEWHDTAKLWQTPEVGEQVIEMMAGGALAAGLSSVGVPTSDATMAANHFDDTMGQAILDLYRSAIDVGSEWAPDLTATDAPGLILWGERDPYASPAIGQGMAARLDCGFRALPCGHWWQLEAVDDTVSVLEHHWSEGD